MGCIPGPGYKQENEHEAYWAAGYRDGGLQCQGAIDLNLSYAKMAANPANANDNFVHGRRWWSEIDCGPLYEPYSPWDCTCGAAGCMNNVEGQVVHMVRYPKAAHEYPKAEYYLQYREY